MLPHAVMYNYRDTRAKVAHDNFYDTYVHNKRRCDDDAFLLLRVFCSLANDWKSRVANECLPATLVI